MLTKKNICIVSACALERALCRSWIINWLLRPSYLFYNIQQKVYYSIKIHDPNAILYINVSGIYDEKRTSFIHKTYKQLTH